ncbi:MAG: PqqD family protein [Acetobacteraceae bacterium]|nr:PqqD family protein [Acetobacteraceae bacterium]
MADMLDFRPRRALRPWSKTQDGIVIYGVGPTVRSADNKAIERCSLNHTGAEVWRLCDGKHRIADIAAIIAERYGQDPVAVQRDVLNLIEQLAEKGYVEVDYDAFF